MATFCISSIEPSLKQKILKEAGLPEMSDRNLGNLIGKAAIKLGISKQLYEKYIDLIAENELFLGSDNWNYLYDVMKKNSKDHLEYYYDYKEKKTYYEEDDDGNRTKKVKYIRHTGWSTDPYHEGNTGEIAYVHTMYFGYAIEEKNGKRKVIKSGLYEDMREIIKKYPYFSENPTEIRTVTLYFPEYRIPDVTLEDFGNPFGHPDLEHKELDEEYIKKPKIFIK